MNQVSGLSNQFAAFAIRQQAKHQAGVGESNASLASGLANTKASSKPSDQAIATQLTSLTNVLDQASTNAANLSSVIQVATGAINNMQSVLSKMDALAAKANADDIGAPERSQVNAEYEVLRDYITTVANRAEWNGTALLTGGAGAVALAGAVTEAADNAVAVTDAFAAGVAAASAGMITGTAINASATANVNGGYDYSLTIQEKNNTQTFVATNITPANNATFTMISQSNPNNQIVMTFAAAVTGITNEATANSTFNEAVGLNTGSAGALMMTSGSTAANNGADAITAASTANAGTYALIKGAGANAPLQIQDTAGNVFTATASNDGAQNITFNNGLTVNLGAGYTAATAITQMVFDVAEGTGISLISQTGSGSADTSTASFSSATGAALGIASTNVSTKANAVVASNAIKAAIANLSQQYARLGAQQTSLESIQENVAITTENLRAALSGYQDAKLNVEIAKSVKLAAQVDVAGVAIAKGLMESQRAAKVANAV